MHAWRRVSNDREVQGRTIFAALKAELSCEKKKCVHGTEFQRGSCSQLQGSCMWPACEISWLHGAQAGVFVGDDVCGMMGVGGLSWFGGLQAWRRLPGSHVRRLRQSKMLDGTVWRMRHALRSFCLQVVVAEEAGDTGGCLGAVCCRSLDCLNHLTHCACMHAHEMLSYQP